MPAASISDSRVTVSGNTISWSDGWYQVQDASNNRSVCEGGNSCTVEPGTYHVINLTTGVRIENFQVGEPAIPPAGGQAPTMPGELRADVYDHPIKQIAFDPSARPSDLTIARTWRDSIAFDHDSNPATEALASSMKSIVQSANGYVNTDDRVGIRYGQGPDGELYLFSKRNNMVYLISNSLVHSNLND